MKQIESSLEKKNFSYKNVARVCISIRNTKMNQSRGVNVGCRVEMWLKKGMDRVTEQYDAKYRHILMRNEGEGEGGG